MQHNIKKICVIGSGVMGAGIAAAIANASLPVVMLDIVTKNDADRNYLTRKALEKLKEQKPAPFAYPNKARFITIGNLDDDLELIKDCDLVIEVVIEKLDIKQQLYDKIIPYLKNDAIIASNTSTLPLASLKSSLPPELKSRFVITHFFNPPRYMELVELVTDDNIAPNLKSNIENFLYRTLGKTVVHCKDTPGFIANRVGCFLLELVVRAAIKRNLDQSIVDSIFTKLLGLPNTGVFGLYDLIGLDVMKLISSSLLANLTTSDMYHEIYEQAPLIDQMLVNGWLGRKTGGGFYKMALIDGKKTKQQINFINLEYSLSINDKLSQINNLDELLNSADQYGQFFQEVITKFYTYLLKLIPAVTDKPQDIDTAIKLGYSWAHGPFELLEKNPALKNYVLGSIPDLDKITANCSKDAKNLTSEREKDNIFSNEASKCFIYKNMVVFELNTKGGSLNMQVFDSLQKALIFAKANEQNLVICSNAKHFSVGADLKFLANCIENKDFTAIEAFLHLGQKTMQMLKESNIKVISCAHGAALGGGCELLLHSDYIIAHQELNAGLVEVGVGLIPSWGGIKEIFTRAAGDETKLARYIDNILSCYKSSSAYDFAAHFDIYNIRVIMNKHLLLEEAAILSQQLEQQEVDDHLLDASELAPYDTSENAAKNLSGNQALNYSPLAQELLATFEALAKSESGLDSSSLLEFERTKFLELCARPAILTKIGSI